MGLIGFAVLTFIEYKQTNTQTNKQTDKPNLYIDVATQNDERNKPKCILNSNLQLNLKNEIYIFGLVFMLWKWMTIF